MLESGDVCTVEYIRKNNHGNFILCIAKCKVHLFLTYRLKLNYNSILLSHEKRWRKYKEIKTEDN